jgi:hypothetical protein
MQVCAAPAEQIGIPGAIHRHQAILRSGQAWEEHVLTRYLPDAVTDSPRLSASLASS